MGVHLRDVSPDIIKEKRKARKAQDASIIAFRQMAEAQEIEDKDISKFPEVFTLWTEEWTGKAGSIVQDEGELYRSIHGVEEGQNTKPSQTPSMWTHIGDPTEEWPEWIQPLGAHDAYAKGAKVSHNGKHWTSDIDSNTYEPGVYGWTEQPA